MPTEIETNQDTILRYLYGIEKNSGKETWASGKQIAEATKLEPIQINDAIHLLYSADLVEWLRALGTAPYTFTQVRITPRGKYEIQRREALEKSVLKEAQGVAEMFVDRELLGNKAIKPPAPIGSPYGFTDADWETVSGRKAKKDVLNVVLGCKFQSPHYNTEELKTNVQAMFKQATERYNKENQGEHVSLEFVSLHAGYGEHVFNEIARDIISSDIAIFETSDLVPNVFIEVGVALTWGSRVMLIKKEGCQTPPTDISGQTYADYVDNAKTFVDTQHEEKLYRMVERAIRKKRY